MKTKLLLAAGLAMFSLNALAKIPAPPPETDPAKIAAADKAKAEKAEKDKAAAEKTKADQARYEDLAVKNFQANMKKAGKPIPKPTPVVAAAPPTPAAAAPKAPPAKDAAKKG
jgi:hypothetical protein